MTKARRKIIEGVTTAATFILKLDRDSEKFPDQVAACGEEDGITLAEVRAYLKPAKKKAA